MTTAADLPLTPEPDGWSYTCPDCGLTHTAHGVTEDQARRMLAAYAPHNPCPPITEWIA